MSRSVIVKEPVRLDILARDLLGSERDGMVEAMLAANPGMADDIYAIEGATVIVPEVERPASRVVKTVDPWE